MRKLLAAVLVLAAVSVASAGTVQYGVVGGGIYAAPNISSESYDWWVDYSWDWNFPTTDPSTVTGHDGYVLLALNPYTGEVWTTIPNDQQAVGGVGGNYEGHASSLTGTPLLNLTPSATGLSEDCIFITAEFQPDGSWAYFGAFIQTSSDGGIYSAGSDGTFAGIDDYYGQSHSVGDVIGASGFLVPGSATSVVYGYVGAFNGWGYAGDSGTFTTVGFQMDGIDGWMSLTLSGDRSGVTLNEYYFDVPEPATMGLLAFGGIAALIRRRK